MENNKTPSKLGHWFGPVAAIRPYVFQKCFTLMLGFDLLVLMVERGARYGTDAIPFNVPHFKWIDAFHHAVLPGGVPSATYYVCIVSITSFLCFCLFFGGHQKWLMAVVCGLFTYAWSMSRLDSYLHHYLLSLIMLCMVFFPRVNAIDLRDWLLAISDDVSSKRKQWPNSGKSLSFLSIALLCLAVAYRGTLSRAVDLTETQRWFAMLAFFAGLVVLVARGNKFVPAGRGPYVTAWSYRLLVTTVGVVYVFAAVAKMDAEWCGGHTLRAVGTTEQVLQPIATLATSLGIAEGTFWAVLATFVVPLELLLAAMYILSVWQDEPSRVWFRRLCFVGWLLAIGLHLNNEMMNLIIQWFGYYMLLLATLLLVPARFLLIAGQAFIWPECWIRDRFQKANEASGIERTVLSAVAAFLALLALIGFAGLTVIPGAMIAGILLSAGLILVLVLSIAFGAKGSLRLTLVSLAASLAMVVAVWQSSMRFDYFDMRGKTLQLVGNHAAAAKAMEDAMQFSPPTDTAAAELLTNLGLSYRAMGKNKDAEKAYRNATARDPLQFLAHYNLANLLVDAERLDEAEKHYRQAIAIKSDNSDAMLNLGSLLEFQGRIKEAIECYEQAAAIEPGAEDIQHFLKRAREKE